MVVVIVDTAQKSFLLILSLLIGTSIRHVGKVLVLSNIHTISDCIRVICNFCHKHGFVRPKLLDTVDSNFIHFCVIISSIVVIIVIPVVIFIVVLHLIVF